MDDSDAALDAMNPGWRSRVKPLLGTLVEISIPYYGEGALLSATELAFSRIEVIHHAMSFHESTSDVRAIARARAGDVVRVSIDTFQTLLLAREIERDSRGSFNPTIAPELVARGLLPAPDERVQIPTPTTLATSIALESADTVRIIAPVWIDLGGIAKGYAVDAAVAALEAAGVAEGVVNAGGDLRVFGANRHTLALRLPSSPTESIKVAELHGLSCATSGGYWHDMVNPSLTGTHPAIVGPQAGEASRTLSVSVIAHRCAVADALTKVLWLRGHDDPVSAKLLAQHHACAVLLDAAGNVTRAGNVDGAFSCNVKAQG